MIPNIGEETERIEFKKSTGEMKDAIISIAAILNKHGAGELFFGVKDNGDVIPNKILNIGADDEIKTYENRFVDSRANDSRAKPLYETSLWENGQPYSRSETSCRSNRKAS